MRRRRLLGLVASAAPATAGCTGGPGDPITSLAVNRDGRVHTVSARVVRDGETVIEGSATVDPEEVAELGTAPWRPGRYRVTARVDGEPVVETGFESDGWFNQLDVVIDKDGSAELNRGRAA